MSVLRRDPVCHQPGHGRYPKGSTCLKCRADARKYGTSPEPAKPAVTESQLPVCGRCGKKMRGTGICPTAGC